jgi:deoxyribodipyrimidine photolyase-related protein
VVLMAGVRGECRAALYHRRKLVLVLSAMRHFARVLAAFGVRARDVPLEDPANTHSLRGEVRRAVAALQPRQLVPPSWVPRTPRWKWRLYC